jgi:hypothetical protein
MASPPEIRYTRVTTPPPPIVAASGDTVPLVLLIAVVLPIAALLGCVGYLVARGPTHARVDGPALAPHASSPRVAVEVHGDLGGETPLAASPKELRAHTPGMDHSRSELHPTQPLLAAHAEPLSPGVNPLLGNRAVGELGLGSAARAGGVENHAAGESPWSPTGEPTPTLREKRPSSPSLVRPLARVHWLCSVQAGASSLVLLSFFVHPLRPR